MGYRGGGAASVADVAESQRLQAIPLAKGIHELVERQALAAQLEQRHGQPYPAVHSLLEPLPLPP